MVNITGRQFDMSAAMLLLLTDPVPAKIVLSRWTYYISFSRCGAAEAVAFFIPQHVTKLLPLNHCLTYCLRPVKSALCMGRR